VQALALLVYLSLLLLYLEALGAAGHGRKYVVAVHRSQHEARAVPRLGAESAADRSTAAAPLEAAYAHGRQELRATLDLHLQAFKGRGANHRITVLFLAPRRHLSLGSPRSCVTFDRFSLLPYLPFSLSPFHSLHPAFLLGLAALGENLVPEPNCPCYARPGINGAIDPDSAGTVGRAMTGRGVVESWGRGAKGGGGIRRCAGAMKNHKSQNEIA
jgi:hypothetical protein